MNLNNIGVVRKQAYCCDGVNKEDGFIIWMTKLFSERVYSTTVHVKAVRSLTGDAKQHLICDFDCSCFLCKTPSFLLRLTIVN